MAPRLTSALPLHPRPLLAGARAHLEVKRLVVPRPRQATSGEPLCPAHVINAHSIGAVAATRGAPWKTTSCRAESLAGFGGAACPDWQ
eukprot:12263220-Alexandrium_andersonii.AAC.1